MLRALRRVPRHRFVPDDVSDAAYEDRPLPIGHGQTISQPAVVAVMSAAVAPKATDRCLEIGTGSGYQAAVLAELCARVYSIEYVHELARFGEKNLRATGYGSDRVALRTGDGYRGWPDAAPFHVIVVTAAPERVPAPLLEQLAQGGRLVIPSVASTKCRSRPLPPHGARYGGDAFEKKAHGSPLRPVRRGGEGTALSFRQMPSLYGRCMGASHHDCSARSPRCRGARASQKRWAVRVGLQSVTDCAWSPPATTRVVVALDQDVVRQ